MPDKDSWWKGEQKPLDKDSWWKPIKNVDKDSWYKENNK